ncbi:hypothetical protein BJ742DRAFT_831235 [Cladochytrium replicatum]|nr:hypothetical protein BJ742DRAFT_831235 [Cladochytrium replicatum]
MQHHHHIITYPTINIFPITSVATKCVNVKPHKVLKEDVTTRSNNMARSTFIFLLLIAFSAVLLDRVSAIVQDPPCKAIGGTCQKTTSSCKYNHASGYCKSSGSDVKCCAPSEATCTNVFGTCEKGNFCPNFPDGTSPNLCSSLGGKFKSDLCKSSGSSIKCCVGAFE